MTHRSISFNEPNYPIIALVLFFCFFLITGAAIALGHFVFVPIRETLTPLLGLHTATAVTAVLWMITGFIIALAIGKLFSKSKAKA